MNRLTQKERVVSLAIDLLILLLICALAFGNLYPPVGDSGFWFYTALLSVLVGSKIVTPFYVKPIDAISYAVPARQMLSTFQGSVCIHLITRRSHRENPRSTYLMRRQCAVSRPKRCRK